MKLTNNTMLRPLFFLLAIFVTGVPGTVWAADQVPKTRTVVSINVYDGLAAIKYTPAFSSTLDCGSSTADTTAVLVWGSSSSKNQQLAAIMTAHALNQRIGFGLNGCSGFGGGTPIIYRVDR